MRFKSQRKRDSIPELNLVPMIDVLMAVLTFFIVISMTFTRLQVVDVQLPSDDDAKIQQTNPPEPLIVQLNSQGEQVQILVGNQPITKEQLFQQMQAYLGQNPQGAVLLTANPEVDYEKVVQLLAEMRDLGGDRVSLAINSSS